MRSTVVVTLKSSKSKMCQIPTPRPNQLWFSALTETLYHHMAESQYYGRGDFSGACGYSS
jgi:hypothetical protein